jgi:hypothetical protein
MCMSKRRRYRRSLAVLILLLILLCGAWTGVWYFAAGRMADRLAAWEQSATAAGFTIRHDPPVKTGWPMAAGIRLAHFSITGGGAYLPGGLSWQAGQVTLARDIRHLGVVFIGVDSRQLLQIGARPPIAFQARRMMAQAGLLPGNQLGLIQAHATGVLAAWPAGQGKPLPVSIAEVAAAVRADGAAAPDQPALIVAAELHDIGLPRSHMAALGNPRLLSFDADLSGPVPPPAAGQSPAGATRAWAAAGGRLTLRAFQLVDGPLTLGGKGHLQLTPDLEPRGALTLDARGLGPALDRLAEARVMTAPEARAMKAVTSLLAPRQNEPLVAPFTLDKGLVRLGTIPLFHWPQ